MANLELTKTQVDFLLGVLNTVITESEQGVDVWLAPGGVLDVNGADGDANCFCDFDDDLPLFIEIQNKLYALAPSPIKVAITHTDTLMAAELVAVKEFDNELEALNFVNDQLIKWRDAGKALAEQCGGAFEIDLEHEFTKLNGELLELANGGESMFVASVDKETLTWLNKRDSEILPE